jgi:DNA-binding transcriptional MocR family regulator
MRVMEYHNAIFASKLSSAQRLTALGIASFYNWKEQSMGWPSNKTLSEVTGLSISTIVKAKNVLVNEGYLEVWRRIDNSNMYNPMIPMRTGYAFSEKNPYSQSSTKREVKREYKRETKTSNSNEFDIINSIDYFPEDIREEIDNILAENDNKLALQEMTPAEIEKLLSWG